MAKTGKKFEKAPKALLDHVRTVMDRWHMHLIQKDVRLEILLVFAARNKDGDITGCAIKVRGQEAAACVRLTTLEERVSGRGDAIIWIDGDRYKKWSMQTLHAIIDHELTHIELYQDVRTGTEELDDAGRYRMKMRQHDFEVGWFHEVAERHGPASYEVMQAQNLIQYRQQYFPGFNFVEKQARKRA